SVLACRARARRVAHLPRGALGNRRRIDRVRLVAGVVAAGARAAADAQNRRHQRHAPALSAETRRGRSAGAADAEGVRAAAKRLLQAASAAATAAAAAESRVEMNGAPMPRVARFLPALLLCSSLASHPGGARAFQASGNQPGPPQGPPRPGGPPRDRATVAIGTAVIRR